MIRLIIGVITLALLSALVAPSHAAAQSISAAYQPASGKPLMIIRFNQRRVFYKKPLYTAMSKALEAAPAVRFNLVSYVPAPNDAAERDKALALANKHLREVTGEMRRMGVPAGQIAVNNEMDPSLRFDEIHIFVQ